MVRFSVVFALLACFLAVHAIRVNVMMPLDSAPRIKQDPRCFDSVFQKLKDGGVHGVMVDVWWGLVERNPRDYDFSAYYTLAQKARDHGLKMQCVISFHRCGGNVGDTCNYTLPRWVFNQQHLGIFYKDKHGHEDSEYLSLGVDHKPFWNGRSAVRMYEDFMAAFASTMREFIPSTIDEVQIGMGPAGELRYPSYQLDRWHFPGVGEFQCYDRWMLDSLRKHAQETGHYAWTGPPSDAGDYNSFPYQTDFFRNGYKTEYGKYFLEWYSDKLIQHGSDVLDAAKRAFRGFDIEVAAKVAGIHWWFLSESHAAELTAGYYNTREHQGYMKIAEMYAQKDVIFDFTCFEMRDNEQPGWAKCGPYEMVGQTLWTAKTVGVAYAAENALPRYDQTAYDTMKDNANRTIRIKALTYLRLNPELTDNWDNWNRFTQFVSDMRNM